MVQQPEIPKRLAARLRAAYSKVQGQRDRLAHAEARIDDCLSRIAEFEADPERFAELYYRHLAVDSYPVQTTMERTRENLEYRQARMPVYLEAVAAAELLKVKTETEVLDELQALRPRTTGRVAWPREPTSLESLRASNLKAVREGRAEGRKFALDSEQKTRLQEEKRKAAWEVEFREINDRMDRKISFMVPAKAAATRAYWEALKSAFGRTDFSAGDIFALANRDEGAHQKLLDDARARLLGPAQ